MFYPSTGYGQDPNANRVIEELASVLIDVEQRLQTVKIGLAQAFPHLAPAIQQGRGTPFGLGQFGQPQIPQAPIGAQGFGPIGATPFGMTAMPFSPYGAPQLGATGVNPLGLGLGGFPSFRY